jgi:hypothetical protein
MINVPLTVTTHTICVYLDHLQPFHAIAAGPLQNVTSCPLLYLFLDSFPSALGFSVSIHQIGDQFGYLWYLDVILIKLLVTTSRTT